MQGQEQTAGSAQQYGPSVGPHQFLPAFLFSQNHRSHKHNGPRKPVKGWEYLTKIADKEIPAIPITIIINGCFSKNFIWGTLPLFLVIAVILPQSPYTVQMKVILRSRIIPPIALTAAHGI